MRMPSFGLRWKFVKVAAPIRGSCAQQQDGDTRPRGTVWTRYQTSFFFCWICVRHLWNGIPGARWHVGVHTWWQERGGAAACTRSTGATWRNDLKIMESVAAAVSQWIFTWRHAGGCRSRTPSTRTWSAQLGGDVEMILFCVCVHFQQSVIWWH